MANFSKSFNFRNGVQVDNDNFIVNPSGLVGIGTTVPTEILDVLGSAKISGVSSLTSVNVSAAITAGVISIDAPTGIITATKFVGDASGLTNIVAISTAGFTELSGTLSTTSSVGIGSTQPDFTLDVLGDFRVVGPSTFTGITTVGSKLFAKTLDIEGISSYRSSTGITTILGGTVVSKNLDVLGVSTFSGNVDVNGELLDTVQLNVSGIATISSATINNLNPVTSFSVTGVSTFTGAIDANAGLDVDGQSDLDEVVVAGVSTFNNTVDINAGLDVDGQSDLDEVVVAGVSTFSSLVDVNNRLDVVGGANIDQANVSGVSTLTGNVSFASSASFANTKQLYFGDSLRIFSRTDGDEVDTSLQNPKGDIEIQGGQINIGNIGTGLTITGTYAGFTTSNVSLYSSGVKKLETVGTGVSVFDELNVAKTGIGTYVGIVRFGSTDGAFPYAKFGNSFDLINEHNGNFNYYLDAGASGGGPTGHFHWHKGTGGTPIMTLTNTGNLGVGLTQPTTTLEIQGSLQVSGVTTFSSQITASSGLAGDVTGNLTGNTIGFLIGNVSTATGVSTFRTVSTSSTSILASGVGVGVQTNTGFAVNSVASARFFVDNSGRVGIRTDVIHDFVDLNVDGEATIGGIGIGTTALTAAVDFHDAGRDAPSPFNNRQYMYPPKITTTERNNLVGVTNGAMVYNTSGDQLQIYIDGWVGIGTTTKVDS